MKVKEIDRTANIAWSPDAHHPIYIAAGTSAQQLDASFSTTSSLEIYSLNLTEPGLDMGLKGSIVTEYRFHKIAWGCQGMTGDETPNGILVGGADGGKLLIYNPAKLLQGEEALLYEKTKHTGPVQCLDFNCFQSNLLASGSSDSEIFIWDLNSPNAPMTPGAKSQPPEDITCVAWNKQVQHILASTFPARCVVWDLRKNEPIIKVSDSTSRLRCKCVAWHPEVATQLCLASEDDHSPVVQLWDLRFATSPLKTLEQHQRGVLCIAWCPQDPDLLLSCGKDNRILCWNPNSNVQGGEVVCEVPTGNQWNFDVAWCPRNPAVISSASFDGHISVYSLMGGQQQVQPSSKLAESFPGTDTFAQPPASQSSHRTVSIYLQKPPKWLRKPVGASFGFGGKLVTFSKQAASPGSLPQQPAPYVVYISQIVTETELMKQSEKLESSLTTGNLSEFCQSKIEKTLDKNQELTWSFLQANFDVSPRAKMLSLLGYDPQDVTAQSDQDSARSSPTSLDNSCGDVNENSLLFESIASKSKENDFIPFSIRTDDEDTDSLLNKALLTGNVEAAVSLCLKDQRWADALILAQAGGLSLLQHTQNKYFKQATSDSAKLISAVVTSDWAEVVQKCDINCWKEALAAILTYAKPEEFSTLCENLGGRLEGERNGTLVPFAILCYICAGNLEKLAQCWLRIQKKNVDSPSSLQELVEQVMILRAAVAQIGGQPCTIQTGTLSSLLGQYAAVLAAQGSLKSAITYLVDASEPSLAILRDRIYQSLGMASPSVPFQQVDIKGSPAPVSAPAAPASSYMTPSSTGTAARGPGQYHRLQQQQPSLNSSAPSQFNQVNSTYPYGDRRQSHEQIYQPVQQVPQAPPPSQNPAASVAPPPAGDQIQPAQTTGKSSRTRYPSVHDPTMYSEPSYGSFYQSPGFQYSQGPTSYSQTPYSQSQAPNHSYYSTEQNYSEPGAAYSFANSTTTQFSNVYNTPVSSQQSGGLPPPPASNSFSAPPYQEVKSGWNDPPPVKQTSKQAAAAAAIPTNYEPPAAITTPIFGAPAPYVPEPPTHPGMQGSSAVPSFHPGQSLPQQPPAAPMQQQVPPPVQPKQPEPPKEKDPIPPGHQVLQDTYEDLRQNCVQAATNPQIRRKLDDVARKLENLYDKLRDNTLTQSTILGLHQIVQAIQQGDYGSALGIHSQLVSSSNFSETSSFFPGLKVLLQVAQQQGVYLQ